MSDTTATHGRLTRLKSHLDVFYHWKVRKSRVLPYLPTEISIELTNRCNFKCAFCPQSSPTHFDVVPASALTPDRAEILLKKIRDGGVTTPIIHWTLDGEPFMNKRFSEVAHVAVAYGFTTHHFATNGFFVKPDRLRAFPLGDGVRYFCTTDFCSEKEYFEDVRGTPGSWDLIKNNLHAVLADPDLTNFNFKITDISSFSVEDKDELMERFGALKELFPKTDRMTFHTRVFHNMTGFMSAKKDSPKYNLCPYPWFSFIIGNNGDVVACCRDLEHKTVLGNLFEQDFEEIWNGEKYQELRAALIEERPDDAAACQGCDMPWDKSKFSVENMVKTAVHRALLLER